MSYKTKLIFAAIVSAIIAGTIWYTSYFTTIGTTLFYFATALIIIFLVLFFVSNVEVGVLKRFSIIYILISIVIVSIPMQPTGSLGPTSFIDNEAIGTFLAILFLLISLGLIAHKTIQLKKKQVKIQK